MLSLLDDREALNALSQRLRAEGRERLHSEAGALRPRMLLALRVLLRVTALVTVPLIAARRVIAAGAWPLAVPCTLITGLGLYGCFSILHDCSHGSFLPWRRANRALGSVLAIVLLTDFDAFRETHLGHHRASQSSADPGLLAVGAGESAASSESASRLDPFSDHPDHDVTGLLEGFPPMLRATIRMADRVLEQPKPLRLAFYVALMALVAPFALLFSATEFSLLHRDWKRAATRRSALVSVLFYGVMLAVAPSLAAVLLVAVLIGYLCIFTIFLNHLGPEQLAFAEPLGDLRLTALNISDVRAGMLLRFAGGGFSEYHAAHHLFPHVPVYHLERVDRWFASRFGELRPAPLDFLAGDTFVTVFDAIVAGVSRPRNVGYLHIRTASGDVLQRIGRGA